MRFPARLFLCLLAVSPLLGHHAQAQVVNAALNTEASGTVFYTSGTFASVTTAYEMPLVPFNTLKTKMMWKGQVGTQSAKLRAAFSPDGTFGYFFFSDGTYTKRNLKTNKDVHTKQVAGNWGGNIAAKARQICAAVRWYNGYSYVFFSDGTYDKLRNHDLHVVAKGSDTAKNWKAGIGKDAKKLTGARVNQRAGYAFFYFGAIYWRFDLLTNKRFMVPMPSVSHPVLKRNASVIRFGTVMPTMTMEPLGTPQSEGQARWLQYTLSTKDLAASEHTLKRFSKQEMLVKQRITAQLISYGAKRYLHIGMGGSKISASTSGALEFDKTDMRGYFLESAAVRISPLVGGLALVKDGPQNVQGTGSTSSTSGVSFAGGGGVDKDGPKGSFTTAVSFSNTYVENLTSFKAVNTTKRTDVKHDYKMSSSSQSETWSVTKGGLSTYDVPKDLIRMDAAGQFSGTPLNYLSTLAKANMPLISQVVYALPDNFGGMMRFRVKIIMTLRYVEKTNKVFVVESDSRRRVWTVDQTFQLNAGLLK